jgi:membrane-associated protease RseP (regulator of RpoE activity)
MYRMNWLLILVLLIAIYAAVALTIYTRKIFPDHITFYGPIMAIKSSKTAFLDRFIRISTLLRIYGSLGIFVVVFVSIIITLLLVNALWYTLVYQPGMTQINEPQNIFLIPGLNDFIPSTFAVWFALVLTIAIHEFGHGILCRVENIRVKGIGIILAVIPIGAFVEPDEEELEKTQGVPKMRMFGAGIMNNLVIAAICFIALFFVMSSAVPTGAPVIQGIYQNYSAYDAGVPPNSLITAVNGVPVATREQVSEILSGSHPGDITVLQVQTQSTTKDYALNLSAWPQGMGQHSTGFMGVNYYDGSQVTGAIHEMFTLLGFLKIYSAIFPNNVLDPSGYLKILSAGSPETAYYSVPYPAVFWEVVYILYWSFWINFSVGIFNALPMIPLDGGYILKEGVERILSRRGLERFSGRIVNTISTVIIVLLVTIMAIPLLIGAK